MDTHADRGARQPSRIKGDGDVMRPFHSDWWQFVARSENEAVPAVDGRKRLTDVLRSVPRGQQNMHMLPVRKASRTRPPAQRSLVGESTVNACWWSNQMSNGAVLRGQLRGEPIIPLVHGDHCGTRQYGFRLVVEAIHML